jgi:hypothetical protein
VGGWVDGRESRVKDCLQQLKIKPENFEILCEKLLDYIRLDRFISDEKIMFVLKGWI